MEYSVLRRHLRLFTFFYVFGWYCCILEYKWNILFQLFQLYSIQYSNYIPVTYSTYIPASFYVFLRFFTFLEVFFPILEYTWKIFHLYSRLLLRLFTSFYVLYWNNLFHLYSTFLWRVFTSFYVFGMFGNIVGIMYSTYIPYWGIGGIRSELEYGWNIALPTPTLFHDCTGICLELFQAGICLE